MKICATILFLLAPLAVFAEEKLTLQQATELVIDNNPAIKAAEFEQLTAHYKRQAARGLYMPKISTTAAWATLQKDIAIDINPLKPLLGHLDIAALLGLDWSYTLQNRNLGFIEADVTIPLFTGGKIIAANRAAEANIRAAEAESKGCHCKLFSELVERYFGVALATNVIQVRQLAVKAMEQHKADITLLIENGMATNTALLQINYNLAKARQQLSAAESALNIAQKALCTIIGTESVCATATPIFICKAIETLDTFLEWAKAGNAQLKYIEAQRALSRENIAINRANFFPEVAAFAGGGFGHNVSNILPRWAVGIGLRFTIFDGLNREYNYAAAKSTARRVEELQNSANQDIKLLIESLYNKCTDCLQQVISLDSAIAFATDYSANIREAFMQDMASSTDVIDATLALAAAQIEQLEAAYNFDLSLAKLLEATGESYRFLDYMNSANSKNIEYEAF